MSSYETQDFRSFSARFDHAALSVIGPYQGVRYFASGGMAWVYEARHPQFPEKRLAVKLMKPEVAAIPMMRDRFLREAQLLARIGHPHLVSVHSFGVDETTRCPYFAMDYIDGGNLAEKLQAEGPLSVQATGELYDRVLGALSALHREGVIHRDIKPLNIFLWRSGEPMLADLGIARDTAASGAQTTQHYIGSPKYSSPEQAHGMRLDPRSDIFSLGLSVFETLVGYHPYEDAKNVDTSSAASLIGMLAVLYRDKKPIRFEFPREIPKSVRQVIRTACEIQPDKRYADADAMRRALRSAMRDSDEPGESALAGLLETAREWLAANGRRVGIGAAALAALAALAVGGYAGWDRLQRGRAQEALASAAKAVTAIAPDDLVLANRLRAAGEELERDRPEVALGGAAGVCGELADRLSASLEKSVDEAAGALGRAKYAIDHAGLGGETWRQLDALARDEARRAPRSGGESACAAPLRLEEYSRSLRDAARALDTALAEPAFKQKLEALRARAHASERAIDQKALAAADAKLAVGALPEAYELYARAELDARAAELAQTYAAPLRELGAAPEFADRSAAAQSALARVVKLGSLADPDALAAELDPAAKEAAAALEAARGDVTAALAAGDGALARAKEAGVSADGLARGGEGLASARSELEQNHFTAALATAKATRDELEQQAKRMLDGAAAAKDALAAARAKREDAVAVGAGERTLAKGDALLAKADILQQAGKPADAADVLAAAATEFVNARALAIGTAGKIALAVRDRAAAEKKKAAELGATAADLAPGDEAAQKGEQALAANDFNGAQEHFGAARDAYQRAPLRLDDERAVTARADAVGAGAPDDLLAKGDAALAEGRAAAQADDAQRAFAAAEAEFARAAREAVAAAEQAKARALKGRDAAETARKKTLAKYPEADLSEGDHEVELGNAALQASQPAGASEHYALAADAYRAAVKTFEAALAEARSQRQLAASAQARAVRAAATEPDLRAGRAALAEGDAALARGEAKTARERFAASANLFDEAAKAATGR